MKIKNKHLSSAQIINFGFGGLILTGTLLLMLPFATIAPGSASFVDCLFTATSASCVTGLVVGDTATTWTLFGKIVIITLIQIGGMGVVTMAVALTVASGRKIGLSARSTMQESISAHNVGGIVRLTGFIIKTSICIELIGALMLAPSFIKEFGILKGVGYSLFHSISAFCNAGFDLMGVKEKYSSLTYFVGNGSVNFTICMLITVGGLGFLTWDDIKNHKFNFKRYRLQSQIAIVTSAVLVVLSILYFGLFEYSRPEWADFTFKEKFWATIFTAVTPRTAGFNTTDYNLLTESGKMVTIVLMLIGGCPGSTAGGLKTATMALLFINAFSIFKRSDSVTAFGRRISDDTVRTAATLLLMYIILFLTGALIISRVENIPLLTCMFETASAVGTVGLTLGITPGLGIISKLILIALMFLGRVGGLTLIYATVKNTNNYAKLPLEKLTVG